MSVQNHTTNGVKQEATPAFLIFDTESIPDGKLISQVKYPGEEIAPADAVNRAQAEARETSFNGSDFLPVTFQIPVAVCVLRVGGDFRLQNISTLDAPAFRPQKITEEFWNGVSTYRKKYRERIKLVTFNGRGFDLPLMELAAFRYGCSVGSGYMQSIRYRFGAAHIDVMELLSNYNACRIVGGLDLLSKILGKPGKMSVAGDRVWQMHQQGKLQEINDYCMFDTLDTYFVFLRTRVMLGEFDLAEERRIMDHSKEWLTGRVTEIPALQQYLDNWGDWQPQPT